MGANQIEEGLQHIFQEIAHIRGALGTFEVFGDTVHSIQESIEGIQFQVGNTNMALHRLVQMAIQIGAAQQVESSLSSGSEEATVTTTLDPGSTALPTTAQTAAANIESQGGAEQVLPDPAGPGLWGLV
ncbi:unnamed protein product [Prorocentrum cordatum]|uniref:Uncharacterized protein n=1 Tax=Prorocentrum cordatum TaxID=2364126 RepID=A0ABN9SR77_9DINO|nr:unnamed protein product [Polarella glacialis]